MTGTLLCGEDSCVMDNFPLIQVPIHVTRHLCFSSQRLLLIKSMPHRIVQDSIIASWFCHDCRSMLLLAVPRRGIVVGLSDRWGGVIEISPHPTLRHIYINGALPPSFIPFFHICHSQLSKKLNTSNKRPAHVRVQDGSINKRF